VKRSILTVPVRKIGDSSSEERDLVAVEDPLQIRLGERNLAITMRTPGHDDELAVGFLLTEGMIRDADQIAGIERAENTITVTIAGGTEIDLDHLERHFYLSSSCGVCGKASIEALTASGCTAPPRDRPQVDVATIHGLPAALRVTQSVFDRTGGLHAAALFDAGGKLQLVREDVGRHNAVDKVVGRSLLDRRLPLHDSVLFVSGRTSFELVQKALMAGIPVLAAVGAPSSLAVETARRFGMTLIGFVRDARFNIYSGETRVRGAD
jgi:FdhD protein